jgi:hypothetical protein
LTAEQSFSRGGRPGEYPTFVIDLHWKLEPPYMMPIDFATLLQNTQEISLCGQRIRKMKPELELIYLCVHAAKHQWHEIRWLADIEQIIQKHQDLDWNSVFDLAKSVGAGRKVDMGLALCRSAFSNELQKLPERKRREIEQCPLLKKMVFLTQDEWSWQRPRKDTLRYSWWYSISLADRPRQSLAILTHELFCPNVPTYERCPLPASLYRLYHIVHPVLLTFSFLAARLPALQTTRLSEAR